MEPKRDGDYATISMYSCIDKKISSLYIKQYMYAKGKDNIDFMYMLFRVSGRDEIVCARI